MSLRRNICGSKVRIGVMKGRTPGILAWGICFSCVVAAHATTCATAHAMEIPPFGQGDTISSTRIDTGEFAVGPRSYAEYRTPWACVGAALRIQETLSRSLEMRRIVARPSDGGNSAERPTESASDPIPVAVGRVARECSARFSTAAALETLEATDLASMYQLALLSQDDGLALTIVRHWGSVAPVWEPSDTSAYLRAKRYDVHGQRLAREELPDSLVRQALHMQPARYALAESLVVFAPTLQHGSRGAQLALTGLLLSAAAAELDTVRMRRYAELIVMHWPDVPKREWSHASPVAIDAFRQLTLLSWLADHDDSLAAVAQRAKAVFAQTSRSDDLLASSGWHLDNRVGSIPADSIAAYTHASLDEVRRWLAPAQLAAFPGVAIQHASLPEASWLPGTPPKNAVRLVIWDQMLERSTREWGSDFLNYGWFDAYAERLIDRIRGITERYGAKVAVVIPTYVHGLGVLRGLPSSPAQEIARLERFYRDYLKLPIYLAVGDAPWAHADATNDARFNAQFAYWAHYFEPNSVAGMSDEGPARFCSSILRSGPPDGGPEDSNICWDQYVTRSGAPYLNDLSSSGELAQMHNASVTVIDPNGRVLYHGGMSRLLDVVLARATSVSTSVERVAPDVNGLPQ